MNRKNIWILLLVLYFINNGLFAQERYVDAIFSEITIQTYSYSEGLDLDFYTATQNTDRSKPLILLVHGGGFSSGKRDSPLEKKFSETMAKKGFSVASMSYRLTRKEKGFNCDTPAQEKIETFAWAAEDVLQATSNIIENAATLGVNPQKIILVGSSAGAEAVLHAAFMRKLPKFQNPLYANIRYAGVISFAGAMLNVDYISKENAIPSLFFHGKKDNLVPYKTASHHYCDKKAPGYLVLDGSKAIAKRLRYFDIAQTVAVDAKGNHDWANLAYAHTSIIANFITKSVLSKDKIKSKLKVKKI